MLSNQDIFWEILVDTVNKLTALDDADDSINVFILSESTRVIRVHTYDLITCSPEIDKIVFRIDSDMELTIFNKSQFNYIDKQVYKNEKETRYWLKHDVYEILEGKFKFTKDLPVSTVLPYGKLD